MSIFQANQTVTDPVNNASLPIRFELSAMEHVVLKHVRDHVECSCWDSWQRMLAGSLRQRYDTISMEMLAEVIFDAAKLSLALPIVLFYVVGHRKVEHRIVLLAKGAVCILRGSSPARFRTCFFPRAACQTIRPERRFGQVAMHYLEVYAEQTTEGHLIAPYTHHVVSIKGDQPELRAEIRFVSAANWGFCQDMSGTVHSGRMPEWEHTPRSSAVTAANSRETWSCDINNV